MIAVVTDSASMLPPTWQENHGVAVVPMTVVVDGVAHHDGVDLSAAQCYAALDAGTPMSTAAPAPGELLDAYRAVLDAAGASAEELRGVVSVHTGSDYSAVLEAARVAARLFTAESGIPVELVDTGTVSFPVALCVAAAVRASDQDDPVASATAARAAASVVDSIFVIGVPELALRSGRLGDLSVPRPTTILTLGPTGLAEHGTAEHLSDALARMADHVRAAAAGGAELVVGVGDAGRPELGDRLAEALHGAPGVAELVRYEVGPSVAVHSGPGTVGAVWAPAQSAVEPR